MPALPVQPATSTGAGRDMGNIKADYLTSRGPTRALRWYFQPKSAHRKNGWKAVRLHDSGGVPIRDGAEAAVACGRCAAIYKRWCAGDRSIGPDWIDANGHVKDPAASSPPAPIVDDKSTYAEGTIAAIDRDYRESSSFTRRKKRTQVGYKSCLDLFAAAWGQSRWQDISPKAAKEWIELIMEESGAHYGHQVMRVVRAMLNKTRLLYDRENHPGIVPEDRNPFRALDVKTPEGGGLPWPKSLVEAWIPFCDAAGRPSIGDLIACNAWMGQRITEFIQVPLARFREDQPLWVHQGKTASDVVIPWQSISTVTARIAAAEKRRKERGVAATTFVYDDRTGLPFNERDFNDVFRELRDLFCALVAMSRPDGQARWPTDYLAKCFDDDPFALDVMQLQARALRHTAITLYADAGVSPGDISAITGQEESSILTLMKRYRKRTKARAGRAIAQRLASEGEQ